MRGWFMCGYDSKTTMTSSCAARDGSRQTILELGAVRGFHDEAIANFCFDRVHAAHLHRSTAVNRHTKANDTVNHQVHIVAERVTGATGTANIVPQK